MLFITWLILTYLAMTFVRTDSKKTAAGESTEDETAMLARLILCLLCLVGPLICLFLPVTRLFVPIMGLFGGYLVQRKDRLSLLVGCSFLAGALMALAGFAYMWAK